MPNDFEAPRWMRDLGRFLPLKSQFVLTGNVRDLQASEVMPGVLAPQGFNQTLADMLRRAGYAHVVLYDPITGFQALDADPQQSGEAILSNRSGGGTARS